MPNRILREGIITSEPVNRLSWPAEVFYRRLHSIVDDYGRYYGNLELLRAGLYPLKLDSVSSADVGKWLSECEAGGLVSVYDVEQRKFLAVIKFGQHIRAKCSKFPDPPDLDEVKCTCIADEAHMRPNANAETETETKANAQTIAQARARAHSSREGGKSGVDFESLPGIRKRKVGKA